MYTLNGNNFTLSIDGQGRMSSFVNTRTGQDYVKVPDAMWKLIYSEGLRVERPVYAENQDVTILQEENQLTLCYEQLKSDDRVLDVTLKVCFQVEGDAVYVTTFMENRSDVQLVEWQLTPMAGVQKLREAEEDYLVWPERLGHKIKNPAFAYLSVNSGFRPYEMPEQIHTDLNVLYPGVGSMQWFDWYNAWEGLYIGCHDTTHQTVCLRAERNLKQNTLRLGAIKYPFCDPGETWESAPIVIIPHQGDWHTGADIYRSWLEKNGWEKPQVPAWVTEFQGWLRVIMKPHHCEQNWNYSQIPMLFDEAQAAGINTLFLLGWEKGGFARMWPDFEVADDMGGREMLQKGIDYIHSKGGKVILFLSYYLIDHQSEFYRFQGGDKCTMKTIWNEELPFAETYCGEGTYRKICNPPMPMYAACPSSPEWQDKMLEVTKYCMDLGADGVLYDLGGRNANFCFSKEHTHKKPSHANCGKEDRYAELRRLVRSYGEDKITLMEYMVDIYAQHMDIVQPSQRTPYSGTFFCELYRYTFPENMLTNRSMAMDENNYRENINYSFLMSFAFDLSIFRCLGLPSEIPNYVEYMKQAIALRQKHGDYMIWGRFVDTQGFTVSDPAIRCAGYRRQDGALGVAYWNTADVPVVFSLRAADGTTKTAELEANSIGFCTLT